MDSTTNTSPFDTSLNTDLHENTLDTHTMTAADMIGGAVSTVVDIGTSLWNSLPGTPEVSTTDLLTRMGADDALKVYNEHPDTIEAASFVGGMFLPMGIATKTMEGMRAGVKGVGWFSKAGKEADVAKMTQLFSEGASSTAEYKGLMRGMYAKTAVNQAIDAVAMEAALVGLYHAHPYMEDYMKDPMSNFTISALLGAGLGSGVGIIADRFAFKAATGAVQAEAQQAVYEGQRAITTDMTSAVKLQSYDINVKTLEDIIQQRKDLGKTETNDIVYNMALKEQTSLRAEQATLFETMISKDIAALPKEEKDAFMRLMIDKTEMYGVDKISLLTAKEVEAKGLVKKPTFGLEENPSTFSTTSAAGPTTPVAKEAVYFPDIGLYGTKKDAIHYAGAVSFQKTKEQLAKDFKVWNTGKIPNYDTSLELLSKSAAQAQGEYIATWEHVMQMKPADVAKLHIAEGDGPWINALLYRLNVDQEFASKFTGLKMSDTSPVIKQILKEHTETLVASGKMTPGTTGPGASYQAAMDNLNRDISNYLPGHVRGKNSSGVEYAGIQSARELINAWIGGDKMELQKAAIDYLAKKTGGYAASSANLKNAAQFESIYESAESKALRARFSQLADSDGNVYLYRGWKTNSVKGANPLDSYTTHYEKALQFVGSNRDRGVKLYKVPVEDIVAGFKDVGPGAHNSEIIVRASARPVMAELNDAGKAALKEGAAAMEGGTVTKTTKTQTIQNIQDGTKIIDKDGLEKLYIAQKQEAIDSLLDNGMPFDAIAIKTNTNKDIVKAYAMIRQTGSGLDEFIPPGQNAISVLNGIKKYEQIDDVLAPRNLPVVLKGNLSKNPLYTQNHIALNNKQMLEMNKMFTFNSMAASKSSAAAEMIEGFYGPTGFGAAIDTIMSKIGKVNNELFGNSFLSSFDFAARNMDEVGPAVSAIGKFVQNTSNNLINRVVKPIEAAMTTVQKDIVALTEFNTFYNVNAGLKGWRDINKDGYLVQKVQKLDEEGKTVTVIEPVKFQGQDYRIVTPAVRELVENMARQGNELKELANTINRIKGSSNITDIGLWVPSFNPVDKHIAYVHDTLTDTTKLIYAKSVGEFEKAIKAVKEDLVLKGLDKTTRVVTKDEQYKFNILNGRLDVINMQRADVGLQKGGSSAAEIIKPDPTLLGEIAKGYDHYITAQVRNLADLNMSELTDSLKRISDYTNRFYSKQPFTEVNAAIKKPKDAAAIVRNTLLANSNLGEYAGWKWANSSFETASNFALNTISDVWNHTVAPLTKGFLGRTKELDAAKVDWVAFQKKLDDAGIVNPFAGWDAAAAEAKGVFNIENSSDTSKRIIYGSNALVATMALRFAELAQPLVNAMSLPVLTGLAIANKMPETFMGVQKATAKVFPTQVMYEGVRAMHSPMFADLNTRWEKLGYFSSMVSEATDIQRATRTFDKGAIPAIERALDSTLVKVMSKPADMAESMTRKVAMNTGAVLAKRLYPELNEAGITIFARDFMDKAIGNFHASQRPVFYQGTLGVAMGLFQTYMLTLGQSIYRHLELKNYKALGKAALTQNTLFGTASLPGFEQISQLIGEHFSDDNIDLTTGTYRALNSKVADFMLYGMPSVISGASFSSRGDISMRSPAMPFALDKSVAYQFATQSMQMIGEVKKGLGADYPEMGRALGQALSLQSMSRPLARGAELATGYSITKHGNSIQVPEEVWSATGIMARILATRPVEEQKLRDADHLNTFYGAADRANRGDLVEQLRTKIRSGTLDGEGLSKISESYFRYGGSPAGWRSAYAEAAARTSDPGRQVFLDKLKPNSPLNYMIDNLD